MVVFERPIARLIRFQKVFFPTRVQLADLVRNLGSLDILRVFSLRATCSDTIRPVFQIPTPTVTVDLSKGIETIYGGMHSNCRYKVRRAEKMHDRFEIAMNTDDARQDFVRLYNAFARRHKKIPQLKPYRFNEYLPHADVFMLYFEGRPTCGRLVLRDDETGTALMLYSATTRLEPGTDTITVGLLNRYLHWHELKTYHCAGLERYDFGGIGRNASLNNFKMSFGGNFIMSGYAVFAVAARAAWRMLHAAYTRWTGEALSTVEGFGEYLA